MFPQGWTDPFSTVRKCFNCYELNHCFISGYRQVGKDNVNLALSLVGYDEEVKAAMAYVFGTTFVCNDMDNAKKVF